MIELLRLLREHEELVEADLLRFYQVDYLDRWRFDGEGRRLLTLRRIWVLIKALPEESRLAQMVHGPIVTRWDVADHLLDDLRMTVERLGGVKKPQRHPSRPKPKKVRNVSRDRRRKVADGRRRLRERRRKIEEGVIE